MVVTFCTACGKLHEVTDRSVLLDNDSYCTVQCLINRVTSGYLADWKPEPGSKPS